MGCKFKSHWKIFNRFFLTKKIVTQKNKTWNKRQTKNESFKLYFRFYIILGNIDFLIIFSEIPG